MDHGLSLYLQHDSGKSLIEDFSIEEVENNAVVREDGGPTPPMYHITIEFNRERPQWLESYSAPDSINCVFEHSSRGTATYEGDIIKEHREERADGTHYNRIVICLPSGGAVSWDDFDLQRLLGNELPR